MLYSIRVLFMVFRRYRRTVFHLGEAFSIAASVLSASDHRLGFALQKKAKLSGYVVASGLQYGRGENIFHYFFKVALFTLGKTPLVIYDRWL